MPALNWKEEKTKTQLLYCLNAITPVDFLMFWFYSNRALVRLSIMMIPWCQRLLTCTWRLKQVWDNCKELDPSFAFLYVGQTLSLSLSLSISLFNPKMDKKERSKTCSQLKRRNISLSLSSILKWTKKNGPKHVDLQLKKRKNKDLTFILFECNHTRGFSNVLINSILTEHLSGFQ